MNWKFYKKSNNRKQAVLFQSLTPIDNADGIEIYSKALDFALANKNIRNVAVTGIYGSGKSSFLRTYFITHKRVLWVSLASFLGGEIHSDRPTTCKGTTEGKVSSEQVVTSQSKDDHLLEVSILQQIFYAAKQSELPFSRLRRTTGISWLRYVVVLIVIGALCVGLIGVLQPAWFNTFFDDSLLLASLLHSLREQRSVLFWRSLALLMSLVCYGVLKTWQFLKRNQLRRISGKGVEIELWQKGDESILNKHIDEILYFFESTRYRTIVFEDIDRFNGVDIFTKLREINLLLNEAKQICKRKKPIRFIYALREDLFGDRKDKVKFFDFIIPIVPIINASNSHDILTKFLIELYVENGDKAVGEEKAKVFSDIVQDISPFLSDMRLVKNICNEFAIYKGEIPDCADAIRLFGMIIFKNFFPSEFAKLHWDEGILVDLIDFKKQWIHTERAKLRSAIEERKARILAIRNEEVSDLASLKLAYIGAFVKCVSSTETHVRHGYNRFSISEIAHDDALFQLLKTNEIVPNSGYKPLNWKEIEKEVDSHHTYDERVELVKGKISGQISVLEKENENDLDSIVKLQNMSLSQVAKSWNEETIHTAIQSLSKYNDVDVRLLLTLIANGYIDDQYRFYISVFHGAYRSRRDYFFEMDAMQGKEADTDIELDKPTEVINNLPLRVFGTKTILNLSLFKELVEQKGEKYQAVIKLLATEDWDCCNFLSRYLGEENTPLPPRKNIYGEIVSQNPQYVEHMLDLYWPDQSPRGTLYPLVGFYLLRYLEDGDGALNPSVKRFLEEDAKVRQVLGPAGLEDSEAFTELINKAQIRFSTVDTIKINNEALCKIADDLCAYRLDEYNIVRVVGGEHQQALQHANLSTIIECGNKVLCKYVQDNFESYVDDVYDKLEYPQQEKTEYVLAVLNKPNLSPNTKKRFLDKQVRSFEIKNVHDIQVQDAMQLVLEGNYLSVSWENIVGAGVILDSTEKVLPFVIAPGVCDRLSNMPCALPWDKVHNVAKALAESKELANEPLDKLLKQLPRGRIDDYSGVSATPARIIILFKAHRLGFSPILYERLKSNGNGSETTLAALGYKEMDKALENGEMSLNNDEIAALFNSGLLSPNSRRMALCRFTDQIVADEDLSILAAKFISGDNYKKLPPRLLDSCLEYISDLDLQCAVTMFLDGEIPEIRNRLTKFPEPVSRLARPGSNINAPENLSQTFVNYLKDNGIVSSESRNNGEWRIFTTKRL